MGRFQHKKVAIVGLSVEGADALKFFLHEDCRIMCCDRRLEGELQDLTGQYTSEPIEWRFGPSYLENLQDCDIIVRSPGISLTTSQLVAVKQEGKELTSLTKLFFELCKGQIIGVTGTKGKGTTSTLIYEMLKAGGKKVWLGGNVGKPLLSSVYEIDKKDWVVLELSSFQLEDCTESPHIAVVLAITQDHLANADPHASNFHSTSQMYREAKKPIVGYQGSDDIVIANKNNVTSSDFAASSPAKKLFFGNSPSEDAFIKNHEVLVHHKGTIVPICRSEEIQLRGDHNLDNIAAAGLAAAAAGVSLPVIRSTARIFPGLPFRIQKVAVIDNVSYYNDSFSTMPETTIAAIRSFNEPLILIVGGSEKQSDFTEMGQVIAASTVKSLIVIGQMTERIVRAVEDAGYQETLIRGLPTMQEVVEKAHALAQPGDVVLLSPACASFDMFKNYKDRGEQFTYEVSLLS